MIIDVVGGTYENKFKSWNAQRTINWYPKVTSEKEKNKTGIGLFPRPGLSQFVDISGNHLRGLFTARTLAQERAFAVVDTTLYEINYDLSSTSLGSLDGMATGSRSKVYMALNLNGELMIQDTEAGYIYNLKTNVLTRITDIDYPGGTTLDYADGYFIISDNNGRVSFSGLGDGLSWNGLDFFTPTFKPDRVRAIAAFREEVYCFGDETIEVYINDGETPFIRIPRTSIYYGLAARDSVATWHGGAFFLGKGKNGGCEPYLIGNNYALTPIATPSINAFINQSTNEDAEGYVFISKDGHVFYHLHLPAQNTTLVYDATTEMWHERQSERPTEDSDGTSPQDMYRGRFHTLFKGINLFGDWYSGKVFKEDSTVSTDDGHVRLLDRTSPVFHAELKNIAVYNLELDINAIDRREGTLMFRYSTDGGVTFASEELITLDDNNRVRINNLGTAKNWVLRFTISDPIDIIIMQAVANITVGSW